MARPATPRSWPRSSAPTIRPTSPTSPDCPHVCLLVHQAVRPAPPPPYSPTSCPAHPTTPLANIQAGGDQLAVVEDMRLRLENDVGCLAVFADTLFTHLTSTPAPAPAASPTSPPSVTTFVHVAGASDAQDPDSLYASVVASIDHTLQALAHRPGAAARLALTRIGLRNVYGSDGPHCSPVLQALGSSGAVTTTATIPRGLALDLLYIDDAVAAVRRALEFSAADAVFDIGQGLATPLAQIGALAPPLAPPAAPRPLQPGPRLCAFTGAAQPAAAERLLDWKPVFSLREGLAAVREGLAPAAHPPPLLSTLQPADVIFTSYFSSSIDPQRGRRLARSRYAYLKTFYRSLLEHSLHAVIFHDGAVGRFEMQNDVPACQSFTQTLPHSPPPRLSIRTL